ncbi:Crp/Fnr family transcriptional regulator [Streptomyces sp. BI20]|uniref:Crp/Fnr family transcriptional regulator n=1 Tax=Streptomyces sp. BI20 TaxID=3403460 RepID=UPI003C734B3F
MTDATWDPTTPVFRDLLPPEAWRAMLGHGQRPHAAGELLLRQGDAGTHVLALTEGMVKVLRRAADGKETLLAFRGPGEILGEMAVQDGAARLADVVTISRCRVSVVPRAAFVRLVAEHELAPALAHHTLQRLRQRIQSSEGPVVRRLAEALIRLVTVTGSPRVAVSKAELAQHLQVSRNSVLDALRAYGPGRVLSEHKSITVVDREALAAFLSPPFDGSA